MKSRRFIAFPEPEDDTLTLEWDFYITTNLTARLPSCDWAGQSCRSSHVRNAPLATSARKRRPVVKGQEPPYCGRPTGDRSLKFQLHNGRQQ